MMIVLRYRTQDKMHNHIRYLLAPECVAEANLKLGLGGKNTAWNIKSQSLSVRRTVTLSQGGVCSADSHQYCCPLWPTAERWLTENWVWVTGAGSRGSGGCNIHTHTPENAWSPDRSTVEPRLLTTVPFCGFDEVKPPAPTAWTDKHPASL